MNKINDNARIISKNDFADYVMEHPDKFDFTNFKKFLTLSVRLMPIVIITDI